jgi:hypothetical protein
MDAAHPAALANLEDQGVRGDEGVRAGVQGWLRNASTPSSRSRAMIETRDLDRAPNPGLMQSPG